MAQGQVTWFDSAKGYGFIVPDDAKEGEKVFVHFSGIVGTGFRTLSEGDIVTYDVVDGGPKGPKADNVQIIF